MARTSPRSSPSRPSVFYCRQRNKLLAACPLAEGPSGCPIRTECQAWTRLTSRPS